MEQEIKTNSFKKLLDRLQEDSWQLELLISGFAIFGLFYIIEPLDQYLTISHIRGDRLANTLYKITSLSVYILIFNLVLHVLFRALWIGTLGLRYVFGEIEYDQLNYSAKFTKYLKKKVGSFDNYISKLENISSVIFGISFLLIFYVLSFFIMVFLSNQFHINTSIVWIKVGMNILGLIFSIGALLTFIDFITQGLLKKNKWVSKFYFPVYRIFSVLTLSFLYRPLVYNFLDNKYGRRGSLLLFPLYLIIFLMSNSYYQSSNIIPRWAMNNSSVNIANGSNYENIVNKNKHQFIESFAIQSKVITDPYIKLTIPLRKQIEDPLIEFNPDLVTGEDLRGYHTELQVNIGNIWNNKHKSINIDSLTTAYLTTFDKFYSFKIDSITYHPDYTFTSNENYLGIETYIGIKDLLEGKHIIEFQRLKQKETDSLVSIVKVPFWYYKG